MSFYSIIDCAEEHDTQGGGASIENGTDCHVTLRCAWADRYLLVEDLLSNRREWPHGSFSSPPQAFSATIRTAGTAYLTVGQTCEYIHALVDVNYSDELKDLISESLEPTVEAQTLDYKRFRWGTADGDPLLEGEAPGRLVRGLTIVRTLYEVPNPLPLILLTGPGSTNDAPYTSSLLGGLVFDTETLLFVPPTLSRSIKASGSEAWTVGLKFMYKAETWNKFWRAKTGAYEEIFDIEGAAAYKNNPPLDFSALLY